MNTRKLAGCVRQVVTKDGAAVAPFSYEFVTEEQHNGFVIPKPKKRLFTDE